MADQQIRFDDGAAYEEMMGVWSRLVGERFLDWLQLGGGLKWADIGCGNGAFSDLIASRCAPRQIVGIDPSAAQLDYARRRLVGRPVEFTVGDATNLPFETASCDAVTMALVIFFIPDADRAIAEMARIARPGASVSTYGWDILGGGLPMNVILQELPAIGVEPPLPPNPGAAGLSALHGYWERAGLENIETQEITVRREFQDFDHFWKTSSIGPMSKTFEALTHEQKTELKERVRARIPIDAKGQMLFEARANAIKGTAPR